MALLLPVPGVCRLPPQKLCSFPPRSVALRPPRKRFTVCASSAKKPRKARSNADLCNNLRDFVSSVGFPEGHVPTMKELLQHGRKDLANIVRRRGYKLVRELLATPKATDVNGPDKKKSLTETHDAVSNREGQDEKVNDLAEDVSPSSEAFTMPSHINSANADSDLHFGEQGPVPLKSSANSSFQEKVAKFIQNGDLDTVEDNCYGVLNGSDVEDTKDLIGSENVIEIESSALGEEQSKLVPSGSNFTTLNGSTLLPRRVMPPATGNSLTGDDHLSPEGPVDADFFDENFDVEIRKRENQVEIINLKSMLHQKELELSRLKEKIENEKRALSILQMKSETEISKAHKLISEKDAELHAAEESLSELEEVEIQYSGDGEVVEVAGSFNGWHHRIKMDLQPLSGTIDTVGSRKTKLWSTVLWLYPGTYEIKFIVDGHWKIDPRRESVSGGTIHNNILRVKR
ncbi:protein PTST homolog 3, chloroplastic isoform X2 [Malania oleifera]|uniref:protein PTST homolog 3, chloroplastic isoform X2 n=1 Tax=Malania oleifera TaxID=397392 RepID=UPI0025ADDC03|nr:protein PTST homolog 3, chloroplastic isoform X2 [Malania oleifera]